MPPVARLLLERFTKSLNTKLKVIMMNTMLPDQTQQNQKRNSHLMFQLIPVLLYLCLDLNLQHSLLCCLLTLDSLYSFLCKQKYYKDCDI
jgi:hypothetical protein